MSIHECHRDCRETSSTLPSPSQLQVNMLSLESMATKKSTAVSCEGSSVVFESKPRRRVSKCSPGLVEAIPGHQLNVAPLASEEAQAIVVATVVRTSELQVSDENKMFVRQGAVYVHER
ncbi:hypothetical protein YC2023_044747 [Brassica napus]